MNSPRPRAVLVLEDGTVFEGEAFGALGERTGEVVFTTAMTGYQEILTDPSYRGQLVTMTVPHIGNVGVNPEDMEAARPWLEGFVVREVSRRTSNWRATSSLEEWMQRHDVVGITGVDTRALVLHIREQGAMRGILSSNSDDPDELLEKTLASPPMEGRELVGEVTCPEIAPPRGSGEKGRVVAYDFGVKEHMLALLVEYGFEVLRVPAHTSADEVLKLGPNGVFLSNGPGDPAVVTYAIENVRNLVGKVPLFGICLGHQLLSLALGAGTYKLKFGHRGANQPVQRLDTGQVEITTQNHGFAVAVDNLPAGLEITHRNLNDGTIEGVRQQELKAFSVQYHPEASPGPHDSRYLFGQFARWVEEGAPLG